MKICLKIITIEPVIVQTWSGAHYLRCQIFWRCNFFSISLGVFRKKSFWTIGTALPIIAQTRSGAYFLRKKKIVKWFEELINLNHLTISITEFHHKLVEKLSKKIELSLSHSSLLGRYVTLP